MGTERVESSSALRLTSTGEGQSVVVGVWYRKERPKKPGLNFAMPKSHYNEFEVDQMLVLHQPVDWPHSSDYKDELTVTPPSSLPPPRAGLSTLSMGPWYGLFVVTKQADLGPNQRQKTAHFCIKAAAMILFIFILNMCTMEFRNDQTQEEQRSNQPSVHSLFNSVSRLLSDQSKSVGVKGNLWIQQGIILSPWFGP